MILKNIKNQILISISIFASWFLIYGKLFSFSNWLVYGICEFDRTSHLANAIAFFIYEAPKVLMLLVLIVFFVGIIRSYFTPERTRKILSGKNEFYGNILAALLGVVTPFCSCSAIPLFIGFITTGIPLGVTLSFLISAPMVNEIALVLLFGLFGFKVAFLYLFTGLTIAVISGFIIGKLKLEKHVEPWVYQSKQESATEEKINFDKRIQLGVTAVKNIVGWVWPYVLLGIAVGAGIHGFVPENFMAAIMGKSAWWSVPVAVLIGVPMYSNAAGIIPIVQALLAKGAALGTVLAFMMAVIGLSLPELIILRKVLKPKLIGVFVGIISIGIIFVGYLFNFLF